MIVNLYQPIVFIVTDYIQPQSTTNYNESKERR